MHLDIAHTDNFEEAIKYKQAGYEPVECSFGKESVIGPLKLDHHGPYSAEEPVSLKAFKLVKEGYFRSKFVVTGMADPDSVYCMLALSREIKPSLEISVSIAQMDLDPIGINRLVEPHIRVPAFEMFYNPGSSRENYLEALEIGKQVFEANELCQKIKEKIPYFEMERNRLIHSEITSVIEDVVFMETDLPHRDVAHELGSLVVQYKPGLKIITFSGLSRKAIEENRLPHKKSIYDLFGKLGLKKIYNGLLEPILGSGSGGREEIGGSPRHKKVTREEAIQVYEKIVEYKRSLNE